MKISKPKFLIQIPLALFALQIYLGAIFGYFFAKFLSKKICSLIFEFRNWRLHFHHWLMGIGVLIPIFIYDLFPFPQFAFGFLSGIIFQGIYCYSDWYKILIKKS
ncbi:hypothetical protein AMJ49_01375 [Parcubacteria bacterium DG_74_2]|nr:MAG: hypothetical protein AMJ49_01375 [Parcubacteria bacterium DG_74_2]